MKYFLLLLIGITLFACNKTENTKCTDCDSIRQFDVNVVKPEKWGEDTVYVYDIMTLNYCSSKMKHYVFQSIIKYNKKQNECLSISCTKDSTGTENCVIN
jgi:hypothetical protein